VRNLLQADELARAPSRAKRRVRREVGIKPLNGTGVNVKLPAHALCLEPRWPVALAVVSVALLLLMLPERVRVFPTWVAYALVIALIVPMAAVTLTAAAKRWLRIERAVTLLFFAIAVGGMLVNLTILITKMIAASGELSGIQLLASSVAMWAVNVLMFSLLYWQIDRGGPEGRANEATPRPDWLFPQEGAHDDVLADWRPKFVDYLFLGYSTATAFSTTDVVPLTSRAKMLMMLESAISLIMIVAVMSRAINVLGS
jgi:hypothetical protein